MNSARGHIYNRRDLGGAATSPRPQQGARGAIRVQTDLVDILASVTDANASPFPISRRMHFDFRRGRAAENRALRGQTNRPLDLALMVDSSMSTFKDLKFETEAAAHFIRQVVRPGDTLGVFEFDRNRDEALRIFRRRAEAASGRAANRAGRGHFDLRRGRAGRRTR